MITQSLSSNFNNLELNYGNTYLFDTVVNHLKDGLHMYTEDMSCPINCNNLFDVHDKKYLPTRYVSKFDIVCFMETKTDEVDLVSTLIPGYTLFLNNKKRKYCLCGGISVKN